MLSITLRPLAWLICLLALAACDLLNTNTLDVTPPPEPTAVSVALDATFSEDDLFDGRLSFAYPGGWVVRGSLQDLNGLSLFSSAALADSITERETIPSGAVAALIQLLPAEVVETGDATGPEAAITAFIESLQASGVDAGFGAPTTITRDDTTLARASRSGGDIDDAVLLVRQANGIYILLSGSVAAGELASFEPTLQAILLSADYAVVGALG